MVLPVSFDNIAAYGHTSVGDLIITHGVLYFFPHTESALLKRWKRPESAAEWAGISLEGLVFVFGHLLGPLVGPGLSLLTIRVLHLPTRNRSRLRRLGLWKQGDSSPALQARLDEYISGMKARKGTLEEFSTSLPKPMRFASGDLSNLSITTLGTLRFDSSFDHYDFSVGVMTKKALRDALWLGGFISRSSVQ